MILLDTHVWVWFNMDHPLLSDELREKAPECAVSVIKGGFLTVRRKALIRSAEEERLEVRLQLSPPLE